jgi:pyrrolysyl-tRNA synthetase-like protein
MTHADASLIFTETQAQRLRELGAAAADLARTFADAAARESGFKTLEADLVRAGRRRLAALRDGRRSAPLRDLEAVLRTCVTDAGFVEVVTPHIMAAEGLAKMGIDASHPLGEQVFWLERGRCLRPMLAPNLYTLLRRLGRIWSRPFGIFEIGACFRRDSKGSRHLNEFTMMNLVELGTAPDACRARLEELGALVMEAAGIETYELVATQSQVYGMMIDVEAGGVEVCSAAFGPHPLDDAWGITEPWVGLGFGLERLLMARDGYVSAERVGRSLSYVDGVRLNI